MNCIHRGITISYFLLPKSTDMNCKIILRKLSLLILIMMYAFNAYSQKCDCAEILRHGTSNSYESAKGQSLDESVRIMYSRSYDFWEKYSESKSKSSSLDAAYESFSAIFSSSSAAATAKENFEKSKTEYALTSILSQSAYEKISQKLIDKAPYEAYVKCIEACINQGVFISYVATGSNFIVTATFRPTSGKLDQQAKLTSFSASNSSQVNKNFKKGMVLTPFGSISSLFKRTDPKQESIVKLDFDNFTTDALVIKPMRTGSSTAPVGSIICSVLDYAAFCSLNDIPRAISASELLWVPADGRDVTGSKYAEKMLKVPDLRGVFLRGMNIFDPDNNPVNFDSRPLDPTKRDAGSLQLQSIQKHKHEIDEGDGHSHAIGLMRPGSGGIGATGQDHPDPKLDHGTMPAKTGIKIKENESQSNETRPVNVAVYYYIKIN
jgi:hypothetical protein